MINQLQKQEMQYPYNKKAPQKERDVSIIYISTNRKHNNLNKIKMNNGGEFSDDMQKLLCAGARY
ncbi:hypothetical protein [Enterobacter sp. 2VL]|uniref:hypothetical protein n=1 Tax=Enterobacter sp. 2VL TaxID=2502206 RepID=UPI00201706B9|nr:hypothetical protein [Enterobacter sp. 2VL]